jgi:hypothetical protein
MLIFRGCGPVSKSLTGRHGPSLGDFIDAREWAAADDAGVRAQVKKLVNERRALAVMAQPVQSWNVFDGLGDTLIICFRHLFSKI